MVPLNTFVVGLLNIYLLGTLLVVSSDNIDRKYVKCLVCHRVVEELFNEIGELSPAEHDKKMKKPVQTQKSDIYFDDLMDRLCKKMGEYVRAFNKSSREIDVIPLLTNGKLNIDLSSYEIIKDGDIESLEFYCESIISEYEEDMLQLFKVGVSREKFIEALCLSPEICKPPGNVPVSKDEF